MSVACAIGPSGPFGRGSDVSHFGCTKGCVRGQVKNNEQGEWTAHVCLHPAKMAAPMLVSTPLAKKRYYVYMLMNEGPVSNGLGSSNCSAGWGSGS